MGICKSTNKKEVFEQQPKNKENFIEQYIPEGRIPPKTIEKEKQINQQSKLFICKINQFKNVGTGFLCKIPCSEFPDENNTFNLLPVLITNKKTINKDELLNKKKIEITFDKDKEERTLFIIPERKIYSSDKYDITIIEIFPQKG